MKLKPFWSYYGAKYKIAPKYPPPVHDTIIEPFAGAAGYSLHYPDRKIVLVEKYDVLVDLWQYLISVPSHEVLRIPIVARIDDLPTWVPSGGRALVGFNLNQAVASPRKSASKRVRDGGVGWSERMRARVAAQVESIRHWAVLAGDYTQAPDIVATWFIDPPYQNAGKYYKHSSKAIDYAALGAWCSTRRGQSIVCENAGADWLPFGPFATLKSTLSRVGQSQKESFEVAWFGAA